LNEAEDKEKLFANAKTPHRAPTPSERLTRFAKNGLREQRTQEYLLSLNGEEDQINYPPTVGLLPLTLPLLLPATLLPPPTDSLLELSILLLALAELLLLRLSRCSLGSCGFNPLALANRLRTSVKETTPVSRPEMLPPGSWFAVNVDVGVAGGAVVYGGPETVVAPDKIWEGPDEVIVVVWKGFWGGIGTAGVMAGVGGPEDIGDGGWTTHILYVY
jgi:hypothetical protein